jgi:hypothetical protein
MIAKRKQKSRGKGEISHDERNLDDIGRTSLEGNGGTKKDKVGR